MNREILFRGKRQDTGEWVYGFFVKDPKGQHRIYYQPFDEATSNTYHFVIPETIGQYTGLEDDNGKKIFEGDIVETNGSMDFSNYDSGEGSRREIYSGGSGFIGVRLGHEFDKSHLSSAHIWSNYQLWNISRSLTVTGNIHDNPQNQTT